MTRNKTEAHLYTVELRFSGDNLEPSEISTKLNLQPSNTSGSLQNHLHEKKRRPYWAYNGRCEVGFQEEWRALEDGLGFLVKCLSSRKSEIITLARQFEGLWWCGHFQASFSGGPTLPPKLLTELGSYEVSFSIDNYFSDE